MSWIRSLLLLLLVTSMLACAARPRGEGYTPIVDRDAEDYDAEVFRRDLNECQRIAGESIAEGQEAVLGAATGAAAGTLLGVIFGVASARGAATGAIAGGTLKGRSAVQDQESVIRHCMENREHELLL